MIDRTRERRFLFQSDPKLFFRLLVTNDAEVRVDSLKHSFADMLLCEILRYGFCNDADMVVSLRQLYEMAQMMTVEGRHEILRHVRGFVEETTFISANAFLPFIVVDTDCGIVGTAVIDFVSLAQPTDSDPMSRPRDIVEMIESGKLQKSGAAFGALLHLGDPRVCKLLWPLKDQLKLADAADAINGYTGGLSSACIEFEIDWLESMKAPIDSALFGIVASALTKQRRAAGVSDVMTGFRPFPFASMSQEEWRIASRPVPLAEYTARIAPRLYALERVEPPPRVMPHVLEAWGLGPLSTPEETADLSP